MTPAAFIAKWPPVQLPEPETSLTPIPPTSAGAALSVHGKRAADLASSRSPHAAPLPAPAASANDQPEGDPLPDPASLDSEYFRRQVGPALRGAGSRTGGFATPGWATESLYTVAPICHHA